MKNRLKLPCWAGGRLLLMLAAAVLATAVLDGAACALALQSAPTAASPHESSPVTFMGEFSSVRYTAEHEYGYSVQLWSQGSKVFGLFSAAEGLASDTPCGLLEDVRFNPATGALSFTAKLSIATIYLGKGKQEPTHDLFAFTGTLRGAVLVGVLTHVDELETKLPPTSERLRLPKTSNSNMVDAVSYDDWKRTADAILKFRGPRW